MRRFQSLIRTIPDHPKPGIQFRDVTTLIIDPGGFSEAVDQLASPYMSDSPAAHPVPDLVAGIEARGFIFGSAVAYRLGLGFVPIRKPGKLPGSKVGRDFDLEYGTDRIEMHTDAIRRDQRVLLIDDLIATGGTAEAGLHLLRDLGANVLEAAFVVALPDLGGVERLEKLGCSVRALCEFEGD